MHIAFFFGWIPQWISVSPQCTSVKGIKIQVTQRSAEKTRRYTEDQIKSISKIILLRCTILKHS